MSRWTFYDPVALDTYVFERNPFKMTSLTQPHSTESGPRSPIDGKIRLVRQPDKPFVFTFTGKTRTKAMHDALVSWSERQNGIHLTDHLGRVHELIPRLFAPAPTQRSGVGNPWLMDYTFESVYIRRIP